jgi:hypothetical protein
MSHVKTVLIFWGLEALLLAALGALIFGRFCLGSYLFLLLTGQVEFANRTLPWASTGQPFRPDEEGRARRTTGLG